MAKFIEYKSKPWWNALHMFCVMVLIPLLAVFLFLQGVVSTIGFVLVIACGFGGVIFLYEHVERRHRIEIEVATGKLPKRPAKPVDNTVLEFREDAFYRTMLLIFSICLVLLMLAFLPTVYRTKGAWTAIGLFLFLSSLFLLRMNVWECLVRLRIQGDEVQVIHPFLRGWGNRAFRFVEIASVEVRRGEEGKGAETGCRRGKARIARLERVAVMQIVELWVRLKAQ